MLMGIFRIYNVRYQVDENGIETRDGVLSFQQTITRVRYEDIRSMEKRQSVLDRLLNIGNIEVGTAGTSTLEIRIEGVASPDTVISFIEEERQLHHKDHENKDHDNGNSHSELVEAVG